MKRFAIGFVLAAVLFGSVASVADDGKKRLADSLASTASKLRMAAPNAPTEAGAMASQDAAYSLSQAFHRSHAS